MLGQGYLFRAVERTDDRAACQFGDFLARVIFQRDRLAEHHVDLGPFPLQQAAQVLRQRLAAGVGGDRVEAATDVIAQGDRVHVCPGIHCGGEQA